MALKTEGPGTQQSPFDTIIFRLAQDGLNLKKSLDVLTQTEASRMNNVISTLGGQLLTRPGQSLNATLAGTHHSVERLNDPQASAFTGFWGVGTQLARGASGVLNPIDSGYSGNPLTMLPYRPPLAGASYMFVADSTRKMGKVSRTGSRLQVGLPKPAGLTTVAEAKLKTAIAAFDVSDGTQASAWNISGTPGAVVSIADEAGAPDGTSDVVISSTFGSTTKDYSTVAVLPKNLDLSKVGGGSVVATDDDFIHISIRMDVPQGVDEIRVYFQCSPLGGGPSYPIPGTNPTFNQSAYIGVIRPSDFTQFATVALDAVTTAATVVTNQAISPISLQSTPGSNVYTEFGSIGIPFRRSNFLKIGTAGQAGADWSTITAIYLVIRTLAGFSNNIAFNDAYLTGGFGPDSSTPGAIKYDYRVTNYDPRTGAESNPSDVQPATAFLDSLRQAIDITPATFGDGNIRQRVYRRGGSVIGNWFFVGTNTADGALLQDILTDFSVFAAGSVNIDHDQPITTIDAAGNAVYNQAIRSIWGPVDALIMGCGDPFRPGDVYWCKPGEPDHWPAANHVEVCAPSEELMAGDVFGGQAFVFSRERGYLLTINLANQVGSVVASPTDCTPGMATYWGMTVGPDGIYYVARDGIRLTKGGASQLISDPIRPLFNGQPVNGFQPVDITQGSSIRLSVFNNDLWFVYKDTNGTLQTLLFSIIYRNWRAYTFARPVAMVYANPTQDGTLNAILGSTNGNSYVHSGTNDDGVAISCQVRTGANDFGYTRGDTLFGDVVVDANMQSQTLTVQTFLNNEQTVNPAQTVVGLAGRRRYVFDPFGVSGSQPQKARNVSVDLSWIGVAGASPIIEFAGVSIIPQPNVTMNRATSWDTPGEAETYLTGVWIDADTGTSPRTVSVEYDLNGVVSVAAVLTVNPSGLPGRHKWWFSWSVVKANMIRLRPADNCIAWELYEFRWIQQAEPPRISKWDTNWENLKDSYLTGLDIECDTFGKTKTLSIYADQTVIATKTVNTTGASFVHFSFDITTPIRKHIYRFAATDSNDGLLYWWKWIHEPEPGEQTNWNQNYTVADTLTDKYLKAIIIQADTFGQTKTVSVEVDGVVATTLNVVNAGRTVNQFSFPQILGRIFRLVPTDSFPSRLYSVEWVFDEEPLSLLRWETQELDFDDMGWKHLPAAWVTIKSTAAVTLTTTVYGQSGTAMFTLSNVIPSTANLKQKVYVPFSANKGILYKFVFTSASPFWLYREESSLICQPWGGEGKLVHPFGNDDMDLVRGMHHAGLTAARSGGGEETRK